MSTIRTTVPRLKVFVVGGIDVDKRLDLMGALRDSFDFWVAGSNALHARVFADAGFRFYYYPLSRGSTPLMDMRSALSLYRLYRRYRPDIVHAFATKPAVWGRLAACFAGVPVVIGTLPGLGSLYLSNGKGTQFVRRIYQWLQRTACRRSDLTIFYNDADIAYFLEAGVVEEHNATTIPGSGVCTDVFHRGKVSRREIEELRQVADAPPGTILVTMVSRVIRTKGVLEFAEAAKAVRKRCSQARFLLVGPDDRDSIDRLSPEEIGRVTGSVDWIGERRDIRGILAASDIFVLPSYGEGIPRVLLEAASMALPLVGTDAPGCRDVIRNGENGFLVEPGDSTELSIAIERLINEPMLRRSFAEASRRKAVERFDLGVIAQQMARIYSELYCRNQVCHAPNEEAYAGSCERGSQSIGDVVAPRSITSDA